MCILKKLKNTEGEVNKVNNTNRINIHRKRGKYTVGILFRKGSKKSKSMVDTEDDGMLTESRNIRASQMKEFENWISVNLPENCPNICVSFKREIAEIQIKQFGAKPLYGFESEKEDWLPIKVFITYGGILAPSQRRPEV